MWTSYWSTLVLRLRYLRGPGSREKISNVLLKKYQHSLSSRVRLNLAQVSSSTASMLASQTVAVLSPRP